MFNLGVVRFNAAKEINSRIGDPEYCSTEVFGSVVRSNQEFGEVRSGSVVRSNRGFTEPNRTSKKCTILKQNWVIDEKYFESIFGKSRILAFFDPKRSA